MQTEFPIGTILQIDLDGPYYFDPYDGVGGTREIDLLSKTEFDKKFDVNPEASYERAKKVRELGWIRVDRLIGECVGNRDKIIKIRLYYGIMEPGAYLIIHESQIISMIELTPK